MDDNRVEPGERSAQPEQVLVVVERVATGPVHEPGVGQAEATPVVVELFGRPGQQVGDAGDRDERPHRVAALGQGRQRPRHGGQTDVGHRAVAVTEPRAREADLADEGGERDRCPHRLFAVLGALQRPAHRDERPLGHQAVGQLDDGGGGHARDRFGPRRVLHDTVASAEHVVDDAFPTDRAPFEEPAVVLVGDEELVDEGQHHCGVGAGADLVPPGAHVGGQVVAERADELERQTSPARLGEGGSEGVAGHPTGVTQAFLTFMPPNATTSSVCFGMSGQVVARYRMSSSVPSTWGTRTSEAASSSC